MATITRKIIGGTTGAPFQSAADEIAKVGGVEEEFLFEGTATQYRLAGRSGTDYPADGRWDVEPMSQAPFRSRLHVLRPGSPDAFNGTVVVMWNNVSVGQDNFTVGAKAARMIEDGFALVGVTTQKVGVDGSSSDGQGERVLRPGDGAAARSEELRPRALRHARAPRRRLLVRHLHPGCAAARAGPAARDRPDGRSSGRAPRVDGRVAVGVPPGDVPQRDPADHLGVRRVPDARVRRARPPRSIRRRPRRGLAEIGENTVDLLAWRTYLLRDDLQVPIIVVNSEFEAEQCYPNTQPDTEFLRWWEFAGTGHVGLTSPEDLEVMAQLMPPDMQWCQVSFAPASRAALHALQRLAQRRRAARAPAPSRPRGRTAGTAARRARQRDRRHPAPGPRGTARHPRRPEPA